MFTHYTVVLVLKLVTMCLFSRSIDIETPIVSYFYRLSANALISACLILILKDCDKKRYLFFTFFYPTLWLRNSSKRLSDISGSVKNSRKDLVRIQKRDTTSRSDFVHLKCTTPRGYLTPRKVCFMGSLGMYKFCRVFIFHFYLEII